MKLDQEAIINRLKALAEARYNQGWDTFVECYDYADWIEFTTDEATGKPMSWTRAYGHAVECVSVWRERQAEAASYYDGYTKAEAAAEAAALAAERYHAEDPDYDGPREHLQFIPHASDYTIFD